MRSVGRWRGSPIIICPRNEEDPQILSARHVLLVAVAEAVWELVDGISNERKKDYDPFMARIYGDFDDIGTALRCNRSVLRKKIKTDTSKSNVIGNVEAIQRLEVAKLEEKDKVDAQEWFEIRIAKIRAIMDLLRKEHFDHGLLNALPGARSNVAAVNKTTFASSVSASGSAMGMTVASDLVVFYASLEEAGMLQDHPSEQKPLKDLLAEKKCTSVKELSELLADCDVIEQYVRDDRIESFRAKAKGLVPEAEFGTKGAYVETAVIKIVTGHRASLMKQKYSVQQVRNVLEENGWYTMTSLCAVVQDRAQFAKLRKFFRLGSARAFQRAVLARVPAAPRDDTASTRDSSGANEDETDIQP